MRWPVAAGIVGAALYTVSPLSVCAALLALVGYRFAVRGLSDAERRLLTTLLAAATAFRLLAIALLFIRNIPLHHDQWLGVVTGDDAYGMARALRARDLLLHAPTNVYDGFVIGDMYGANIYNDLLIGLQVLFGPAPYGIRLLNGLLFLAGAVILFRFARSAFGRLPAFAALTLVLFLPSFFVWSISLLKEPLYFAVTAVFLAAGAQAVRGPTPRTRVVAVVIAGLALMTMEEVRHHTLKIGLLGSGVAFALWLMLTRPRRYVPVAAAACVIGLAALLAAPVQQRLLGGLAEAAKIHAGHVFTPGHGYRVLDDWFYFRAQNAASSTLTLTADEAARFVVRAVARFVTTPLPWEVISKRELAFLPEQMIWLAIVLLLPFGVAAGSRRDPAATAVLVGYAAATSLVLALTNGNVGTMVRLRGMILIIVVWLSALGLCSIANRVLHGNNGPARRFGAAPADLPACAPS